MGIRLGGERTPYFSKSAPVSFVCVVRLVPHTMAIKEPTKRFTVPQIAAILGISSRKAYQLIQNGDIPHIRHGRGCIRIRYEDLIAYEESRLVGLEENLED